MKKILYIVIAVVLLAICSLLIASPLVNDAVAKMTAKELIEIPTPDGTEYLESVSRAGKLVGNGNGMQYFGAILIRSDLSIKELQEYYSGYADNEWECIVERQTDREIDVIEHGSLQFETEVSGAGYFIVYSWGSNDSVTHEMDIRGH